MIITLSTDEARAIIQEHLTAKLGEDVKIVIDLENTLLRQFISNIKNSKENKIQLVKYYRAVTEVGLADAKQMVEAIQAGCDVKGDINILNTGRI